MGTGISGWDRNIRMGTGILGWDRNIRMGIGISGWDRNIRMGTGILGWDRNRLKKLQTSFKFTLIWLDLDIFEFSSLKAIRSQEFFILKNRF